MKAAEEILEKYKPDTRAAYNGEFAWCKDKIIQAMEEYAHHHIPDAGEMVEQPAAGEKERFKAKIKKYVIDPLEKDNAALQSENERLKEKLAEHEKMLKDLKHFLSVQNDVDSMHAYRKLTKYLGPSGT
jgi:flagellar motility protein MotE (MotC chaperone)